MPEDMATVFLADMIVKAILFREAFGRDAAVRAGCVDDIIATAEALGFTFMPGGVDELRDEVLGHDETDDVLAGIMAVSS